MAKIRIRNLVLFSIAAVLVAGVAAPLIDAKGYRVRIESALERALNRKVKVGEVRFNLFTGPGFTVSKVEISDDPSIGIEPLAYVESLEARVTLATLWTRQLAFSNLKLKDPTVNLVKSESGVWNFQLLRGATGALPAIQVRNGRINFKFGETKSVFYLSESDLDITRLDETRMDVRFSGQPARTDHAARSFGQLLARGTWKRSDKAESELDVNAELERSAISELARLIEGESIGFHGVLSAKAHIVGPISKLALTGQVKLDDIHRWDLLPKGGGWQLNYRGQADLMAQRLELETGEKDNPGTPVTLRLRVSEMLSSPRWAASVGLHDVPAASVVEAARHMGAQLPEGMQVEGKLNGAVGFSRPGGLQGQLAATDALVKSPGAPVVKFRTAEVVLDGSVIHVGPSIAESESGQTAELEASYRMTESAIDVGISTQGMSVSELQKGAGVKVPVLTAIDQGTWKGSLRYQQTGNEPGVWDGDFELRDARMDLPGFADPVRITSANISVADRRFALTRIKGRAGTLKFSGEYRGEGTKADRIKLEIPEAEVSELERELLPTLRRSEGLLARFRLRTPPAPEWLRDRKVEGTVSIEKLTVLDQVWKVGKARVDWNGTSVRLLEIEAKRDDVAAVGQIAVNLGGSVPHYRLTGKMGDIEYKGGTLGFEGILETRGVRSEVLTNAHAEGTFEGENLAFSAEMEFKSIGGAFEWNPPLRFRLKNIQAGQGFENYTGQGATQPDGRLVLDLSSGKRQVKVAGTLSAAPTR